MVRFCTHAVRTTRHAKRPHAMRNFVACKGPISQHVLRCEVLQSIRHHFVANSNFEMRLATIGNLTLKEQRP